MHGWLRLGVFLSLLWAGGVLFVAGYEYRSVSTGGDSKVGFVYLRDSKTGENLGRLSLAEVKEFGKLAEERSRLPRSDPADAAAAKLLLSAEPVPHFDYASILSWLLLPLAVGWMIIVGVRWVAAGFRKAQ